MLPVWVSERVFASWLRAVAHAHVRNMCDVRTARESERRRRKNAENGVDWCTCYLRRVHAGIQIHVLRVVFGHAESGHCRDCSPGHWFLPQFLPPIYSEPARGLRLLPPVLAAKPASYIAELGGRA